MSEPFALKNANIPSRKPKIAAIGVAVFLNLIPIIGVLFWGWSAFALLLLYWLENVVIGARTALEMIATGIVTHAMAPMAYVFFIGFFCIHYGIFCFGHGTFLVSMFESDTSRAAQGLFDLPATVIAIMRAQPNILWGLASIVLWQIVKLIVFIASGQTARTPVLALMAAPYPRIIILHLTILAGGFLLIAFNEPMAGLVALALLKTAFDVAEARHLGEDRAGILGIGLKPTIFEDKLARPTPLGLVDQQTRHQDHP